MRNVLSFTKALENVEGVTPVAHTVVCIVATLILVPCVFLKDLKVCKIRFNKEATYPVPAIIKPYDSSI